MVKILAISSAFALATINIGTLTQSAYGASFNFSYTLESGDVVSGMMDGIIQPDNDTVIISAVNMPMFNGSPAIDLLFIDYSAAGLENQIPSAPAIVSFSGSTMDFLACDTSLCDDGFLFVTSGFLADFFGSPLYNSGPSYGLAAEIYNPANWNLTKKTITPEPNIILGLFLVSGSLLINKKK